ncbi:MAG: serine/threonine protein kinase [Planctomycetes bacterium]|nr:serine/threonine protein kinase [Planctomycetota bacterium]
MTISDSQDMQDSRVISASHEYLSELERGIQPDREAFYRRDPDLKSQLAEVFDGIELAQQMLSRKRRLRTENVTEPLGDFRIVRELGRGGMGVVYEAVQLSLGRQVALKVLPISAALDARQRQRFQNEAQAAALLHHSNIVPVYAVGCERGMHFYAMQLIEGRSLAEVIAEWKAKGEASASPSQAGPTAQNNVVSTRLQADPLWTSRPAGESRNTVRIVAQYAATIADALEYAHESGVIHRDIKPGNLLLDSRGTVWVTDFGLAHVVADISLTVTGDVLGTMQYMSPEQACGKRAVLDNRTDVYSLGATLYELLTLQPVFSGPGRQSLLYQILNDEPRPLRQRNRSIPVEMETIVLKCLAKSPAERYATAGELAADLRRFLDERPIMARRPTLIDTARKWLRRHPSVAIACVLLLLGGVIGLGVTTAIVANEQQLTRTALLQEKQRAIEAEARFQLARQAADEMILVAQNELSDMPFQDGPRKRLLEAASRYYQQFIELRKDTPESKAELERTRNEVEGILTELAAMRAGRDNVLLTEAAVLDDLQVTAAQREAIVALQSQMHANLEEHNKSRTIPIRGPSGVLPDSLREYNAKIATLITPQQSKRLRQIALQWQGPRALLEYDVAAMLELTTEQRLQIREIERQFIGFPPGPPGQRPPFALPDANARRDAMERILSVLSPKQRGLWQDLIGDPYIGPILGPPMGMPGPPPHIP